MVASLACVGFGGSREALAQDCEIKKISDGGRANDVAQANFTCLTAKLTAAVSRIENLETELAPFQEAKGAVVAFDRNAAISRVCPKGWSIFLPAGGRFIVGAGQHNGDLTEYPSFSEDKLEAIGGEERVTLELDQMPEHRHAVPLIGSGTVYVDAGKAANTPYFDYRRRENIKQEIQISPPDEGVISTGKGHPHNNMPPYIALYYCRKN